MSKNKTSFEIQHLQVDSDKNTSYKGHLEGPLAAHPFVSGSSSDENSDNFKYDIPIFAIKEKKSKSEINKYFSSLKLTQHQKDALIACLLGKIATLPTIKDNRIRFKVSILKQKELFCDLYSIFENWAIEAPVLLEKTSRQKKRKGKKKRAGVRLNKPRVRRGNLYMYFDIYDHPSLSYYRDQFLIKNPYKETKVFKKRVPTDIESILTSRGIAYLFLNRGFFYPKSIDDTPFWKSYSFRLDHLFYYNQLIDVFDKKFGISLVADLDDSHEIYSYNKKQKFTKLLYVRGESREKLIKLISPFLKKEFHNSLYASEDYQKKVENRQNLTKGLDYAYWFPVVSNKTAISKFNSGNEPTPVVKKIIESNDKRTIWLANGHHEFPEETFNTKITLDKKGLLKGLLPKSYFKPSGYAFSGDYGHWPDINTTHRFTPSFKSKLKLRDVVDLKSSKKGVNIKSTFLKKRLKEVISSKDKEKDN
jgi:hypothetical protein